MPREIKFRMWDIESKKMYDWNEVCFVSFDDLDSEGTILMQYTGLKDKNGKEIYEGDIVNKKYNNLTIYDGIGEITMGIGSDSDGYIHGEWLGWKAGESSLLDVASFCEIIGNIYENPELLKS